MIATRLLEKSTGSCGHSPVCSTSPSKRSSPSKCGRLAAERQPTAMMQNRAEQHWSASVSTFQRFSASSKASAVTLVSKRMSRLRSNRSATWLGVTPELSVQTEPNH